MSSDRKAIWLGHIIEECDRVAGFVDGMELSDFEAHEYETIKLSTIFQTATMDLPLLERACRKALATL